jgi:hypothetical protein
MRAPQWRKFHTMLMRKDILNISQFGHFHFDTYLKIEIVSLRKLRAQTGHLGSKMAFPHLLWENDVSFSNAAAYPKIECHFRSAWTNGILFRAIFLQFSDVKSLQNNTKFQKQKV